VQHKNLRVAKYDNNPYPHREDMVVVLYGDNFMGVFTDFKKNACMELEKDISKLENQRELPDNDDTTRLNANIQFAQRINLINLEKAREYRKRLNALEYTRRTQTGIIDDDYENPLEKGIRYSSMDALKEEITHERNITAESIKDHTITKTAGNTKTEENEIVHSR